VTRRSSGSTTPARRSEVGNLGLDDINLTTDPVHYHGKGNKDRRVRFGAMQPGGARLPWELGYGAALPRVRGARPQPVFGTDHRHRGVGIGGKGDLVSGGYAKFRAGVEG